MSEITKHQQNSNVTAQQQGSVAERPQNSVDESRQTGVVEQRPGGAFECPQCHSTEIQRFPVAYQSGISQVNTKTTGIGMSLSGKIGIGGASTKGHSQTELSRMTAPPPKQKYGIWVGLGFAVIVVLALMGMPDAVSTICGAGFAAFFIAKAFRYNQNVHPQLMRQWENSWVCFRCGHKFTL